MRVSLAIGEGRPHARSWRPSAPRAPTSPACAATACRRASPGRRSVSRTRPWRPTRSALGPEDNGRVRRGCVRAAAGAPAARGPVRGARRARQGGGAVHRLPRPLARRRSGVAAAGARGEGAPRRPRGRGRAVAPPELRARALFWASSRPNPDPETRPFMSSFTQITDLLGADAKALLEHKSTGIPKEQLHLPGPDWVDRIHGHSDRPNAGAPEPAARCSATGRLAGTGYLSILPVDQGIEHSAGASLREEPDLLRSREHREARDRGRLQRRRVHASACSARVAREVRAQDPVHR
ncbi:MAG: hypothetical protein MZV64_30065 [Ignavibacteriales bacterium]|nr:hypothetical protein [Ignavibacteriales bacterium]